VFSRWRAALRCSGPCYRAPPDGEGRPELSGFGKHSNTADWDLEGQAAGTGPVPSLGAVFRQSRRVGVVEGGGSRICGDGAKKKGESGEWVKLDPEGQVLFAGCATPHLSPYPFQIVPVSETIRFPMSTRAPFAIINMGAPTRPRR